MRKHILLPLLALVLGGLGAALRMWQRAGYVDGLPVHGSPATLLLLILCAAAALLFLVFARKAGGMQAGALYSAGSPIRAALLLVCAALLLFATMLQVKGVMDALSAGNTFFVLLLELLLILFAIPSLVCIAFLAKDAKTGEGRSYRSLTVVVPIFYCWVWFIEVYRHHTADPILWDYIFLLLATAFLLICVSLRGGFSFGDSKPRLAVFCGLTALFLMPAALVDFYGLPTLFITLGLTLYTLVFLSGLLRNVPMPELPNPEIQTEVSSDE